MRPKLIVGDSSVRRGYENSGLTLIVLDEDEFENEIVNYNETEHRSDSQYAIVLMELDKLSRAVYGESDKINLGVQAKASSVGPPRQGDNTVVSAIAWPDIHTLGHEIGHKLNIHHPGNIDINHLFGFDGWLAVKYGQHSGNVQSFMRYRTATHFCDGPGVIAREALNLPPTNVVQQSVALGFELVTCKVFNILRPPIQWPEWPWEDLPNYIFSRDGKGTGVNSNGWAGNSPRGGDLPQLNVKSY